MNRLDLKFKKSLHTYCLNNTRDKIRRLSDLLDSNLNDLNSATKSSAGDKHETTRAMIHIEQENHSRQLLEAQRTLELLSQISLKPMTFAQAGAVIKTNKGTFYIATGVGKIEFNKIDIYIISPASPLGQKFLNSKTRDVIRFKIHEYTIQEVI